MRRRTLILIHLFLAAQIVLPLHYYLLREDRYDERLAWRMFSTTRMVRCGSAANLAAPPAFHVGDGPRPAELTRTFHTAWIAAAQRGRETIIDAMADELCRRNPGRAVRVEYACRETGGSVRVIDPGRSDRCTRERP